MANPIISVIIRARDQASSIIQSIRNQLNNLPNPTLDLTLNGAEEAVSQLGGIARTALIAAVGIGGVAEALGAAKHAFIDYNAELEQTHVAFTSMLGSGEQATAMIRDLQKFAAETPFEMPGIRNAAQQLIAFGYDAQEIIPTLTALGNAASGLGKGETGFGQLAFPCCSKATPCYSCKTFLVPEPPVCFAVTKSRSPLSLRIGCMTR